MLFTVTVKLPRNKTHDPANKILGHCPVNDSATCTDSTGEHHTVVIDTFSVEQARSIAKSFTGCDYVTRVERVWIIKE